MLCRQREGGCRCSDSAVGSLEKSRRPPELEKKADRDLVFKAQGFIEDMKKRDIDVKLFKGNLLRETLNTANESNANLIIFGREHKEKGLFGLPFKNFKKKLEKLDKKLIEDSQEKFC